MPDDVLSIMLASGETELVDIPLYYKYVQNKRGIKKIVILDDEDGKKQIDEWAKSEHKADEKCPITVLNTKWKMPDWKEQNRLFFDSQSINPATNQMENNWLKYRDLKVKAMLKSWDLEFKGERIPVKPEFVDKIRPEIIVALFNKYEAETTVGEEESGKQ